MSSVCYPPGADWTCAYTQTELDAMRADPAIAAVMDRADALAWMTLATLTGDQIGTCPITVRPCAAGCDSWGTWLTYPVGSGHYAGVRTGESALNPYVGPGGVWVNGCGCSSADCSCESLCEAILPGTVGHITEVTLDGTVLPPSAYRVDNGNRLVRTDGECWPACQDMSVDPTRTYYEDETFTWGTTGKVVLTRHGDHVNAITTSDATRSPTFPYAERFRPHEGSQLNLYVNGVTLLVQNVHQDTGDAIGLTIDRVAMPDTPTVTSHWEGQPYPPSQLGNANTFTVTYYQGAAPDDVTLWAAGLLAVEYFKACQNQQCKLPARVQTVTRQGVTYQVTTDMFTDGGTGIREVDALIARYNPFGLRARPLVTSPDVKKPRLQTWGR